MILKVVRLSRIYIIDLNYNLTIKVKKIDGLIQLLTNKNYEIYEENVR